MIRTVFTNIAKRWKLFLAVVLVLFMAKWLGGGIGGRSGGEEKMFDLVAQQFNYTPGILHVNHGDHVTIRLQSKDVHHGFYLDGYGVTTSARPGEMGVVRFVANQRGRFPFRCSVTCGSFHPYMVGYLQVGPNSRFSGSVVVALLSGLFIGGYLLRQKGGAI